MEEGLEDLFKEGEDPGYRYEQGVVRDPMDISKVLIHKLDLRHLKTLKECDELIASLQKINSDYKKRTNSANNTVGDCVDQRVLDTCSHRRRLEEWLKRQQQDKRGPRPQLVVVSNRVPGYEEILREVFREEDAKKATMSYLKGSEKAVFSTATLKSRVMKALCPHLAKRKWEELWRGFLIWGEANKYICRYYPAETWTGKPAKKPKTDRQLRTWLGEGPDLASQGIPNWWSKKPPSAPA